MMGAFKNSSARTSDWLASQTKNGVLYAHEPLQSGQTDTTEGFSRKDFDDALKQVSRPLTPSAPDEASSET